MRETLVIADSDASFILGAKGRTKRKLVRVARCGIQIEAGSTLVLEADRQDCIERAKLYVGFVMQQRIGPVSLGPEVELRDDLDTLEIPEECVGYVTGHHGQGLRAIEEEFGTLMFFTDIVPTQRRASERLAIFSPCKRARTGSSLKVISAIEQKKPGYFTSGLKGADLDASEGFAVDKVPIRPEDFSYALGRGGSTRKKLARASNAIIEYVGCWAYIAGTIPERRRAADYLGWLCGQRNNKLPRELCHAQRRDMICIRLTGHDSADEPAHDVKCVKDEPESHQGVLNDAKEVTERSEGSTQPEEIRVEEKSSHDLSGEHEESNVVRVAHCVGKPSETLAAGFLRRMEDQTDTIAFLIGNCLLIFGANNDNRLRAADLAMSRLQRLHTSSRKRYLDDYEDPACARYSKNPRYYYEYDEAPNYSPRGWRCRDERSPLRSRRYDSPASYEK